MPGAMTIRRRTVEHPLGHPQSTGRICGLPPFAARYLLNVGDFEFRKVQFGRLDRSRCGVSTHSPRHSPSLQSPEPRPINFPNIGERGHGRGYELEAKLPRF